MRDAGTWEQWLVFFLSDVEAMSGEAAMSENYINLFYDTASE